MIFYFTGFVVSGMASGLLLFLYTKEEERGTRLFSQLRTRFDFWVLKVTHKVHTSIDVVGREALRQMFHYILHAFLSAFLALNKRWERGLRTMLHTNRSIAKKAERDRNERNKLEEIALHKMESALSEEEKQMHKQRSLEG